LLPSAPADDDAFPHLLNCRRYGDHLQHKRRSVGQLDQHLEDFVPEPLEEERQTTMKARLRRES
jgi:hypothetical protein